MNPTLITSLSNLPESINTEFTIFSSLFAGLNEEGKKSYIFVGMVCVPVLLETDARSKCNNYIHLPFLPLSVIY